MKTRVAWILSSAVMFFSAMNVTSLYGQQAGSSANPYTAACGANSTDFTIKKAAKTGSDAQAPEGKALVYVIEQMPEAGFLSTKMKIGIDGRWVGETERGNFISLTLDPGVHHLCAAYQGKIEVGEEGDTILHRLNVEPGKTYYLLYRGIFSKDSGEIAFFDEVDEDEGQYLLQTSEHVTAVAKKK